MHGAGADMHGTRRPRRRTVARMPQARSHAFMHTARLVCPKPSTRSALDFLKLGEDALEIRLNSQTGGLEVAVAKTWVFNPGLPFVGDAAVGARTPLYW